MKPADFVFWVEYEQLLYSLAVQPPPLAQIRQRFEGLILNGLENQDFQAVCWRNIGLLFLSERDSEKGIISLRKALSLVLNPVIKLQLLLILNLLGIKDVPWKKFYAEFSSQPPTNEAGHYGVQLVGQYHRLLRTTSEGKEVDYIEFLTTAL